MSEKEINAYRLTSLEDPTDEMLAYIMREVAEEAKETNEEALKKFFEEIKEMYQKEYGNNWWAKKTKSQYWLSLPVLTEAERLF